MYPQHQIFFYPVKLLDKKLPQKFLMPRNTPRTPTSNQKIAIFGLLTKLRPPKSRGRGCWSAEIFLLQKQLIPISPTQTWLNPESKQESDWKVTFFDQSYILCQSSDEDTEGMKNVLQLPKISKIIFSERSDIWFAPQGTPKLQKILSVWLPHQKHSKNCSFFELDYGYPRCYQHIIWVWGLIRAYLDLKKNY